MDEVCDIPHCWCRYTELEDLPRPAFRWTPDAPVGYTELEEIEARRAGLPRGFLGRTEA